MPQVLEVAKTIAPPSVKPQPRGTRTAEPPNRFKETIDRHTKRPEPKPAEHAALKPASKREEREPEPERDEVTEPEAKSQKPAVKKADRARSLEATEDDRPVDEAEHPAEPKAAETEPSQEDATAEATGDGEKPDVDADAKKQDGDDHPDDAAAALAALVGQPAQKATDTQSADADTNAAPAAAAGGAVSAQPIDATSTTLGTPTAVAHAAKSDERTTTASTAKGETKSSNATKAAGFELPDAADAQTDASPDADPVSQFALAGRDHPSAADSDADGADPLAAVTPDGKTAPTHGAPLTQPAAKAAGTPEQQFVDDNAEKIVTSIHGELMPTGGNMRIRLEPPNMGQLKIDVSVDRTGTISAAFETSNEDAAKLLSHSIQHLKSAIETTGVAVDRIQVRQASPAEQSNSSQQQNDRDPERQNPQDHPAKQEQQRREMLQRMWAKLSGASDDLDLVA